MQNVGFQFISYVSKLSEPQRKKFKSEFGAALCASENGEESYARYMKENPAFVVLSASYSCLLALHYSVREYQRKALIEALMRREQGGA